MERPPVTLQRSKVPQPLSSGGRHCCHASATSGWRLTVYDLRSTVYRLPSTVYRLPSTVYSLPSTVYRPPSTVHRPPSTTLQDASPCPTSLSTERQIWHVLAGPTFPHFLLGAYLVLITARIKQIRCLPGLASVSSMLDACARARVLR
ncbi:uncharacterized protein EKO05_0008283 [Ascochyta rabiei]|uniref:uncharacterized protein n=1 Tax=Didymella rabiei TaxID=5454 RepID=UPI00220E05F8|nr:uncharacterized protein EKO05_0008283 [Ascochyta rabiei]UPX17959.1 hypothetical protein EKO05_0008283 [Ascochyta rabiei]